MSLRDSQLIALSLLAVLWSCDTGAGRIDEACRSNADCSDTELCATGLCQGGLGACVARPTTCPDSSAPVCGCDGQTYQNDCFADMAGIRLATSQPCVCDDNSECVDGQFCALDDSCGNPGTCLPQPGACDPADTQEVCGCDGMSYANECTAFQAGSRVSALGPCECEINDDCGANQYCDAITCDGPGGCMDQPATCPPEGPEVTGCDGDLYDNACSAAQRGVRVRPDS